MMTWVRVYVALGLLGCLVFGGTWSWADKRIEWTGKRHLEPLRDICSVLTLLCLPALFIGAAVVAIGSIGL